MEKVIIGVDVSKDTLDIAALCSEEWLTRLTLPNDASGHQRIVELATEWSAHVVMEATGSYHARFVAALCKAGLLVSVANPLSIKRFGQMKLRRVKTDRSDAMLIAEYGRDQNPEPFQAESVATNQLRQLQTQVALLTRQRTALRNQLHAHQTLPNGHALCKKVTAQVVKQFDKSLAKLEEAQRVLVEQAYPSERALLESINGIGPKVATTILATIGDASRFNNYKQVTAFAGINPVRIESGTSLRPRSHISKQGHTRLRTMLYLAALSAKRHNPACKALYDRLREKGKPPKVALMAVANKLVKQVFAILKSGQPYDPEYVPKLAFN